MMRICVRSSCSYRNPRSALRLPVHHRKRNTVARRGLQVVWFFADRAAKKQQSVSPAQAGAKLSVDHLDPCLRRGDSSRKSGRTRQACSSEKAQRIPGTSHHVSADFPAYAAPRPCYSWHRNRKIALSFDVLLVATVRAVAIHRFRGAFCRTDHCTTVSGL